MSSNNLRSSNLMGLEFDDENQKHSLTKFSPDLFNKTLSRDEKVSSASHVVSMQSGDLDNVQANVELPDRVKSNEGRLTGRPGSLKENQLSKSVAETSINRFKDHATEEDIIANSANDHQAQTPLIEPSKLDADLNKSQAPPTISEDIQDETEM